MMTTGVRLREKSKPISERLQAISHPCRVAIVLLLSHESMTMHEIAENMDTGQTLVVHHLNTLLASGWIKKIRKGRTMIYTLRKRPFMELLHSFEETPFAASFLSSSSRT